MASEELPWWAYSRTPMHQQCEVCAGAHETSQCGYYEGFNSYVNFGEQPYFQYHPQQYQENIPTMSYFSGSEEFQYQQHTPAFQRDDLDIMEEIRRDAKIKSLETLTAQYMEEFRRDAKIIEASIKSMETQFTHITRALEQETQQNVIEAFPEHKDNMEQGTMCTNEEFDLAKEVDEFDWVSVGTYTNEKDNFQGDEGNCNLAVEFDHVKEVDELERALFGTGTDELHKFQELACAHLLPVSKYKDGGSLLEPLEEVFFKEPTALATYMYPPPLYYNIILQGALKCALFYKLTDFGVTQEGIGIEHICYPDMPRKEKRQKVCQRDDDEVTRREDQANYYHP